MEENNEQKVEVLQEEIVPAVNVSNNVNEIPVNLVLNTEPPKKNSNKILIILLVLIALIGLGVGGFFVYKEIIVPKIEEKDKDDKEDKKNQEDKEESKESKEEALESEATPLLYEVTKEGLDTKLYLFGSIHAADDRAYPLPDVVMNAYNSSDALAVEVDVVEFSKDFNLQVESLKPLVLTDGTQLKDHLSTETYNLLINYLKENKLYNPIYESYKPGMHYSLVSSVQVEKTKLDTTKGIDMYFLEKAHEEKKEILQVENALLQYEMLANAPDAFYEFYIKFSIENETESVLGTKMLYEYWLNGDEKTLETTLGAEGAGTGLTPEIEKLINDFNYKLVDERNVGMINKADEYFTSGKNVFYVVGLAHMVGDKGIAQGLRDKGYSVEIVNYS